jgi:four helix bundle protein
MKINSHRELEVYKLSFCLAMDIFHLSKIFPREERYSLTDQIRRSSRSVTANISEAFRARRYEKSFISKLVIAQCEAAEVQTWLEFAHECDYIEKSKLATLLIEYDHVLAMLVSMTNNADKWCFENRI